MAVFYFVACIAVCLFIMAIWSWRTHPVPGPPPVPQQDGSVKVGSFLIKEKKRIPPHTNPFLYDYYNMGTQVASNVIVMYNTHKKDKAKYIIIVDTDTGERLEIDFP